MNRVAHQWAGGIAGVLIALADSGDAESPMHNPLAAATLGAIAGRLPDFIEPAAGNPHHRQFFHSVAVGGALGWGVCSLWQWQPETDAERLLRAALLVGGAAYLSHLLLDATTPRRLPLVGRL